MLSFKRIVRNMIECEVDHFIYEKAETFGTITDVTTESDNDVIRFHATVKVAYNEYEIGGCVTENGSIFIGSVYYERMRCTEKDADGEWILESAKPFTEFIYGDDLKTFTFDK